MDPIPLDPAKPGWSPNQGTVAAGIAGAFTTVISGIAASFGHPLDASVASALTFLVMVGVSYFHPDGRKQP